MNKRLILLVAFIVLAAAIAEAQVAPPTVFSTFPRGARRGATATFTVDGLNLGGATELVWNKPGITARIKINSELIRERPKLDNPQSGAVLIIDKATRNRLTVEADIAPDAPAGIYSYRIKTPLGTTNIGSIAVVALPETTDRGMNNSLADAQEIALPATVVGELRAVGESDYFKFAAKPRQQIVFEVIAAAVGFGLDSTLTLMDSKGRELASNNDFNGRPDSLLGYTFEQGGEYVIRIADHERRGGQNYILNIGDFPYITGRFPLGVRQGTTSEVTVTGFNLGVEKVKVTAPAQAAWNETTALALPRGEAAGATRIAIGRHPEIMETGSNNSPATAQAVTLPTTINGRLSDRAGEQQQSAIRNPQSAIETAADYYRFNARKGQKLILEVAAQRLGSPLDSFIEVLDAQGRPIPRAVLRSVLETSTTLNDRDSASRGMRLLSWNGMQPEDYILIGNELLQIQALPRHPDDDTIFKGIGGQRTGFEDTTPEAHANGTPVYKVTLHPPGSTFSPNGLPVATLYYRNDDGGASGKDSHLTFTAPADGEYIVRIRDVRGLQGDAFAYRLIVREPEPDFTLAVDPVNPNVPQGGQVPITVSAARLDGFDGDITVRLLDLPPGFSATEGIIPGDQTTAVILLSANKEATGSFPLRVRGTATVKDSALARDTAKMETNLVSVGPPPELAVWTDAGRVTLEPGGRATLTIKIERQRGFAGRIPFDVRNLPPGVVILDVGLNGVMITEQETTQKIVLEAQPWVRPQEQPIFVVGRIETTSPQRSEFPAQPVTLVIGRKDSAAAKVK